MSPDLHTFVGAYALDALDQKECEDFEQHLATCDTCRVERAELVETAARLGSVAEMVPPADLRPRVLDAVARTPQQRPTVVSAPERPNVVSLPAHRSRRWATPVLAMAAALLAVLGVGVGIDQYAENQDLRAQQAAQRHEDALVADVLASSDKVAYDTQSPSGLHLTVVKSQEMDAAVVSLRDLPALAEGRSYQLWRGTDGGVVSAGVIDADDISRDRATTLLKGGLGDAQSVAVTEEPAGGSAQPTSDPLVSLDMSA